MADLGPGDIPAAKLETAVPGAPGAPAASEAGAGAGFWRRWWIYQAERFPLVQHGPLILVFSGSAVCYAHMLGGRPGLPGIASLAVAFITCLIFFLQLRIADEFKDFDEDSRYRPYRPVPRGLVTLRQLAIVFILGAAVQFVAALILRPAMIVLLLLAWAYLAAMSKEFYCGSWLRARPILYMVSHMFIMPLVDLYATGCDWLAAGAKPPRGLEWFLVASYFNGLVIEIGRKIRAPGDEEPGVQTYSVQWGRKRAAIVWWLVMAVTLSAALVAAWHAEVLLYMIGPGCVLALAAALGLRYLGNQRPGAGKAIEAVSGVWTLVLYLSLGIVPAVLRWWGGHS